ncbi:hypothetical protein E2C01_020443 [Portunus trituberculatus]|uniref:Uncharacterized protein n=1 Tax=Portunus trituberculatus TaxID=210409 RepID=A0A5B7E1H8_PORTR|nr:hypothetical protein [Portunus trituberculatus]
MTITTNGHDHRRSRTTLNSQDAATPDKTAFTVHITPFTAQRRPSLDATPPWNTYDRRLHVTGKTQDQTMT